MRGAAAGVSARTLDVTPPVYAPGTPRVLSAGESAVAFLVALNEPGVVSYQLLPREASPPAVEDVLATARRAPACAPPPLSTRRTADAPAAAGACVCPQRPAVGASRGRGDDRLCGLRDFGRRDVRALSRHAGRGDARGQHAGARGTVHATRHLLTPCLRTQGSLEVLLFSTPLCDPCPAEWRRLALRADCACAAGLPFGVRLGITLRLFAAEPFARVLAALLALQPQQVALLAATAHGDATDVQLELLPLLPSALPDAAISNLTAALVAAGSPDAAAWAQPFGGFTVRRHARSCAAPGMPR